MRFLPKARRALSTKPHPLVASTRLAVMDSRKKTHAGTEFRGLLSLLPVQIHGDLFSVTPSGSLCLIGISESCAFFFFFKLQLATEELTQHSYLCQDCSIM